MEQFDVVVVGAGLSGIGAAVYLKRDCPERSFCILEARAAIGGTWDLFRYPGIRSDSDMYTLGYAFKPWTEPKAIADGPSILSYIRETADEYDIGRHIRFHHRVCAAKWSSDEARWTLEIEVSNGAERTIKLIACNFLYMCSGYYDYAQGHDPEFEGREQFQGQIIHPQFWPDALDYTDRRVVVIGSGATAVTLVPEMAKTARHVVMLQRSPTYMVSRPAVDQLANRLRAYLPSWLAYGLIRWRNVLLGMYFYQRMRKFPNQAKTFLIEQVRQHLGAGFDVETHFTPRYNPWDQRLCLVPDADLFEAIKSGQAEIVTGRIERLVEDGVKLENGEVIAADIVVTATGLKLLFAAGMSVSVDGRAVDFAKTWGYRGMMYSGVPNLASAFGYTNASWTLKADLTSAYVCRLLNHMRAIGARQAMPVLRDLDPGEEPWLSFSSGYVQRALAHMPKQGAKHPWKLYQNYLYDLITLKFSRIDGPSMHFSAPPAPVKSEPTSDQQREAA